MSYNLARIRQLVAAAFSDNELQTFCFDRFPTVYQDFTAGQTQSQRVLLLIDFAAGRGQLNALLDAIRQANPYQYERFGADLQSAGGQPDFERKPFDPETIQIPAGPFVMGTDDLGVRARETPQHTVSLPDCRIGRYPVTNRQYAEFIKQVKGQDAPDDPGCFLRQPPADRLEHPVIGVSWFDAVAYCRWLSQQTGRPYFLPSETEWEKAASWGTEVGKETDRQGNKTAKRRYPWGAEWGKEPCNAGGTGTTPATAYPNGASAYGVEDLLGNVQGWTCSQWGRNPQQPDYGYPYDPAGGREVSDAASLPAQVRLVSRGGSFRRQPADLRCTARGNAPPDSTVTWRGFRVVGMTTMQTSSLRRRATHSPTT